MANAYVNLTTFKGTAGLDISGTQYDARVLQLIENVGRELDRYAGRHFYYLVETRTFDGYGGTTLVVPDLISIPGSGLKEDTNYDGTFETVWASADILFAPSNAAPTTRWGIPYTKLLVNPRSDGTQDEFLRGVQNYEITGTWGYSRTLVDIAGDLSASIDATSTTFNLTSAGTISVGDTVVIDSEQMYVTSTGTSLNLTVERGANGSPSATHTATANVQIVVYPGPVVEAALIQSARIWKRRESAFATQVGNPLTGQISVFVSGLDADVKAMLDSYRRFAV